MWDMERLRKIAGLQESTYNEGTLLTEAWDDEDEDPDVARAEREAKKRKVKLPDVKVDAEKDLSKIAGAKKSAAKEEADEAAEKKEAAERAAAKKKEEADAPKADDDAHEKSESPAKEKAEHSGHKPSPAAEKKESSAAEKKEEAKADSKPAEKSEEKKEEAAEAKRRGKAPNADSKRQRFHAYLKANPGVKRAVAIKWAMDHLDFGQAYASQQYQAGKQKISNEAFMLRHPSLPTFVLHENSAMGMYQWISETDLNLEPLMFATEAEAQSVADYLISYKNQLADIERIDLDA